MTQTFEFTVTNDQVTAEEIVFGQHTETIRIPSDAAFTVTGSTINETVTGAHSLDTTTFTPETASPALYQVSAQIQTLTSPSTTDVEGHVFGYSFTVTKGAVTAEQIVTGASASATHTHSLQAPPDAAFAVSGANVTETVVQGNEVDVTTFAPSGSTGLFALASHSQSFISVGGATTQLSVDPFERDAFTFGTTGSVATESEVHADGTATAIAPHSDETFTQLAPGLVEETVTHGSHTSFEVFADGNGDGIYTAVAHGVGSAVDFAGLQAQLTAVEPFL
jgi:hypothetical protein